MKAYSSPYLTDYGTIAEITAVLGNPFTGDATFDVDGNVIQTDSNSVSICSFACEEIAIP